MASLEGTARDARPRIVIVHTVLHQYRAPFYVQLRDRLERSGVALDLVHGTPPARGRDSGRGDTTDLTWAHRVDQREVRIGGYELTWQACGEFIRGADLVIVQQATRRLLNYALLARQTVGGPRVAFWGHGRNFQATSAFQRAAEALKRVISRRAHWFFAYNDLSAEALAEIGFPPERVTVVQNAIDTAALASARDRVTDADRRALRERLGLRGDHVGIYCGAMYPEKRLPFLIEAAREIRSRVPDFELICVGSGVDREVVDRAGEQHPWIHPVGPRFGEELARHFALARVHLLPGLVGLAVLDSFVFEVPLVTTEDALHSPEIAYLEDGVNGLMVAGDGTDGRFAEAVAALLTDDDLHRRLVEGCRRSAPQHTVEEMADRFTEGVLRSLSAERRGIARLTASLRRS